MTSLKARTPTRPRDLRFKLREITRIETIPAVLNQKQTAALLGVNRRTLKRLTDTGAIPHRQAGRQILYSRSAVLDWAGDAQKPGG